MTIHATPHPLIRRARLIAKLLDSAVTIPVVNRRVGLDPLLGLLPVWGDVIALGFSAYIVWIAKTLKVPPSILIKMGVNIAIDTAVGAIPVLGDLFDLGWKANLKNLELLENAHLAMNPDSAVIDVQAESSPPQPSRTRRKPDKIKIRALR